MTDDSTRERILATTRMLMKNSQGGSTITVGQVAAAAHVSRATLYRYFPDKAALIRACEPLGADNGDPLTTRERIVQATMHLVGEQGLHATTLDEIAERAGISRSGLQWHYRNKDELVAEVARSIPALLSIARLAEESPEAGADFRTQLLDVADALLRNRDLVRRVGPFLLLEVQQHPEVARLAATHTFGPLLHHFITLFEQHERSGELRPGSAQVRAQALIGLFLALMLIKPAFPQSLTGDDEAIIREQIDILLHGILTHPQKDPA